MSEQRTEISSLGEFGLIKHLASKIEVKNASTLQGIGDDAAVIDIGNGEVQLISHSRTLRPSMLHISRV